MSGAAAPGAPTGAVRRDPARTQLDDAVRVGGYRRVVRDQHDRGPELTRLAYEQSCYGLPIL